MLGPANLTVQTVRSIALRYNCRVSVGTSGGRVVNADTATDVTGMLPKQPNDSFFIGVQCDGPALRRGRMSMYVHSDIPGQPGFDDRDFMKGTIGVISRLLNAELSIHERAIAAYTHSPYLALTGKYVGVSKALILEAAIADMVQQTQQNRAWVEVAIRERQKYLADMYKPELGYADVAYSPLDVVASALQRVPTVSRQTADGRTIVHFLSASPGDVELFLNKCLVPGLNTRYGSPNRGFAVGF